MSTKVGTYPGIIEASTEIKIPQVQVGTSTLPDLGLIDEVLPRVDILQGHQVVDVLNRVLETANGELNDDNYRVRGTTYCISPLSVTVIIPKDAVELRGL